MRNEKKKINVLNPKTGKTQSMPVGTFDALNQNPNNPKFINQGYTMPSDTLSCYYVDDSERINAIKESRPFYKDISTTLYTSIPKKIDNTFIECSIGSLHFEPKFFNRILEHQTYFKDYNERKKVYFTYDKISLFQLVSIEPGDPLRLILKRIDNTPVFKADTSFMIMPFHNTRLDEFYFANIKSYLKEEFNIEVFRADDFRDNDIIIETIYNRIADSEFIIADTTVENKNVFYELGYASALGKEIITIQDRSVEHKLFFDRAHIRSILYSQREIEQFQFELSSTIKSIRSRL